MAKIDTVDISNLTEAVKDKLDEFQAEVYSTMVDACEEGIKFAKKEIVKDIKQVQKGDGRQTGEKRYRSTFTTRKKSDTKRILWNKQYPLSHLLENGHYVYNQFGGPYEIKKSKYGTRGDTTKKFDIWHMTEKEVANFVYKKVLKELE